MGVYLQSARPIRILYVEDDIDTRDAVSVALQEEGYGVFGVANGQTALDYLRTIGARPASGPEKASTGGAAST